MINSQSLLLEYAIPPPPLHHQKFPCVMVLARVMALACVMVLARFMSPLRGSQSFKACVPKGHEGQKKEEPPESKAQRASS